MWEKMTNFWLFQKFTFLLVILIIISKQCMVMAGEKKNDIKVLEYFPIDIEKNNGFEIIMCQIDWASYHANPSRYSFYSFLHERCIPKNTIKQKFSFLVQDMKMKLNRLKLESNIYPPVIPSGMIFHETRCGSTLIANILASNPEFLVYSEPLVPLKLNLECSRIFQESECVHMMRSIISLMGMSSTHKHLFIKWQTGGIKNLSFLLRAFPSTPWIFIFRDPVQIMISHFDAREKAVCLRGKSSNKKLKIANILEIPSDTLRYSTNEDYCAGYLAMCCDFALQEYRPNDPLSILVSYLDLPSYFYELILPYHFNLSLSQPDIERMKNEALIYSKSKLKTLLFKPDSIAKENKATKEIINSANKYLYHRYETLIEYANKDKNRLMERKTQIKFS